MSTYDKNNRIDRVAVVIAGQLKVAAYRVRDPETDAWSPLQFHMTHNNTVMAVMGEEGAKLFARFVRDNLPSRQPCVWVANSKFALSEYVAPDTDLA